MTARLWQLAAAVAIWAPGWAMAQEAAAPEPELSLALWKTGAGLAVVLALLLGLMWLLKRISPSAAGGGTGRFRLVGRLSLGPRKWLGLVHLADKVLVVAVSDARVDVVQTIDDPEVVAELTRPKAGFAEALKRARGAGMDDAS